MQKKIPNKEKKNETHRVAKVIARSGFCSRREAERLIKNGRVKVNEKIITSPALNIKKDSEIKKIIKIINFKLIFVFKNLAIVAI